MQQKIQNKILLQKTVSCDHGGRLRWSDLETDLWYPNVLIRKMPRLFNSGPKKRAKWQETSRDMACSALEKIIKSYERYTIIFIFDVHLAFMVYSFPLSLYFQFLLTVKHHSLNSVRHFTQGSGVCVCTDGVIKNSEMAFQEQAQPPAPHRGHTRLWSTTLLPACASTVLARFSHVTTLRHPTMLWKVLKHRGYELNCLLKIHKLKQSPKPQ